MEGHKKEEPPNNKSYLEDMETAEGLSPKERPIGENIRMEIVLTYEKNRT